MDAVRVPDPGSWPCPGPQGDQGGVEPVVLGVPKVAAARPNALPCSSNSPLLGARTLVVDLAWRDGSILCPVQPLKVEAVAPPHLPLSSRPPCSRAARCTLERGSSCALQLPPGGCRRPNRGASLVGIQSHLVVKKFEALGEREVMTTAHEGHMRAIPFSFVVSPWAAGGWACE